MRLTKHALWRSPIWSVTHSARRQDYPRLSALVGSLAGS